MKLLKIGAIIVFVLVLALVGGGYWLIDSALTGSVKERMLAEAGERLGTSVSIRDLGVDMGSLLRLKPAVSMAGLAVANPPGFAKSNLLEADRVSALLDFSAALNRRVALTSMTIESPRVAIESNAAGKTNLDALVEKMSAKQSASATPAVSASGNATEFAVGEIAILGGTVTVGGDKTFRDLAFRLSGLEAGKASVVELGAKLFDSPNSIVTAKGAIGPFGGTSLPVDVTANLELALAELPKNVRERTLGELVADPGAASRVSLTLAPKGDLEGVLNAAGEVKLTSLLIGNPGDKNRLTLAGTAPLSIRAVKPLSGEELELRSEKASLQLGKGRWNGDLRATRKAVRLAGGISGAIRDVDVDQMMTSFAGSPGKVYGTLAIPEFALNFAGENAAQLQRSLTGRGRLTVDNGRFQLLSVLASIERALAGGGAAPQANGEFAQFSTAFEIANQAVAMNGISVTGPGLKIGGRGTVTFAKALNFRLDSTITGNTAQALKARTGGILGDDLRVPVTIAGTLDQPQVRPEIKSVAANAAKSAAQGILKSFFGNKKN
ncbi:MAG: AsmA-like C-terminal region-containing protein [Bryobacteraceae bacterium]|nr:AsmA-like C-terminal region-containing protein [Bryobacteraceae bacterium]